MEFRDAATRVDSLANSLRIVKRHLTDNAFFPATSGADIISLGPATRHGRMVDRTMTLQATEEKIGWIRDAAGTRFPGIELNAVVFEVAVTPRWRSAAHDVTATRTGLDVAGVMASPHFLVGTVPQIVEKLTGLREALGISYFKVPGRHLVDFAPVVAALHGG